MIRRLVVTLVLLALAAALLAWVWPTRYRYDHLSTGGDTYPVRIDRFTGAADVLLPGDGWTPIEDAFGTDEEGVPDARS